MEWIHEKLYNEFRVRADVFAQFHSAMETALSYKKQNICSPETYYGAMKIAMALTDALTSDRDLLQPWQDISLNADLVHDHLWRMKQAAAGKAGSTNPTFTEEEQNKLRKLF